MKLEKNCLIKLIVWRKPGVCVWLHSHPEGDWPHVCRSEKCEAKELYRKWRTNVMSNTLMPYTVLRRKLNRGFFLNSLEPVRHTFTVCSTYCFSTATMAPRTSLNVTFIRRLHCLCHFQKLHGVAEHCFIRKFYLAKLFPTNPHPWSSVYFSAFCFLVILKHESISPFSLPPSHSMTKPIYNEIIAKFQKHDPS